MPMGGELTIRGESLVLEEGVGTLAAGRYVRIEVTDTGSGIRAEDLPHIFDPFFTTKAHGSGLGLPTSFAVAQRHGGQLSVQSTWGEGTTFTVTLPATDEEPPRETPVPPPRAKQLRVLLLEDEVPLMRVYCRMLEQLGHVPLEAEHGDRALEVARAEREAGRTIDVAMLDLTIRGGRGGRAILDELRAILPSTAMVGMSGYSDVSPDEIPFDAFLPKPFGFERFEAKLREVTAPEREKP